MIISILSPANIASPAQLNDAPAKPKNGCPVSTPFFNILLLGPLNPVPPKLITIVSPPEPDTVPCEDANPLAFNTG